MFSYVLVVGGLSAAVRPFNTLAPHRGGGGGSGRGSGSGIGGGSSSGNGSEATGGQGLVSSTSFGMNDHKVGRSYGQSDQRMRMIGMIPGLTVGSGSRSREGAGV